PARGRGGGAGGHRGPSSLRRRTRCRAARQRRRHLGIPRGQPAARPVHHPYHRTGCFRMMTLQDALEHADKLFDETEIRAAITRMGREIDAVLGDDGAVLLTVMNGALVFAAQLALAVHADLAFDYVHATRYRDNR